MSAPQILLNSMMVIQFKTRKFVLLKISLRKTAILNIFEQTCALLWVLCFTLFFSRDHSFSTHAKFSEELNFRKIFTYVLNPWSPICFYLIFQASGATITVWISFLFCFYLKLRVWALLVSYFFKMNYLLVWLWVLFCFLTDTIGNFTRVVRTFCDACRFTRCVRKLCCKDLRHIWRG